jgi:DNA modification methylase
MLDKIASAIPKKEINKIIVVNKSHLLINGDSLNVLQYVPDDSIDLIITDPPYNQGLNYGSYSKDNIPWAQYYENSKKWLAECSRVLKDTGSLYLINYPEINPTSNKIKKRLAEGSKGRTSYDLLRYMDLIEMSKGMIDVLDINLLKNVSKDRLNKKHPCQLPLSLLTTLVKVSSNKNDIVLDPFAGTFTLSAVAKELNRKSVGIDINPKYISLGLKRLN